MLTNLAIEALKAGPKPYKRADRDGLYLYVTPTGSKLWRMKFRFAGKEQRLSFGGYPEVSLADARAKCRTARQQLRDKVNPAMAKRAPMVDAPSSGQPTFEQLAREWHARKAPAWDDRHAWDVINSLERDAFPALGALPLAAITPPLVLTVLRAIEARGAIETAHRIRQRVSAVFVYGISSGLCMSDPAAIVKGALAPVIKGRQPAIIDLDQLREMLSRAEAERCHPVTKLALRLLAMTVVRPGELRGALWKELDLENGAPVWRLPAERMKMSETHIVPLVPQAVAVIEAVRALSGRCPYLFPNGRSAHKPMSENAVNYLLHRAGYHGHHVPHGFRSAFSSIMNERHPADADTIEVALAHKIPGVRGRYLRSAFNGRRRELLTEWAGLLVDGLMPPTKLLEGPRR